MRGVRALPLSFVAIPHKSSQVVVFCRLAISSFGSRKGLGPSAERLLRYKANSDLVPQRRAARSYFFPGHAYR
jgi:hypothetical protein